MCEQNRTILNIHNYRKYTKKSNIMRVYTFDTSLCCMRVISSLFPPNIWDLRQSIDWFCLLGWLIHSRPIRTKIALVWISTSTGTALLLNQIWHQDPKRKDKKRIVVANIFITTEYRELESDYCVFFYYFFLAVHFLRSTYTSTKRKFVFLELGFRWPNPSWIYNLKQTPLVGPPLIETPLNPTPSMSLSFC